MSNNNLYNAVYANPELLATLPIEDVRQLLRDMGIDTRPAFKKLMRFISETQKQWQPEKSQAATSGPLSKMLAFVQKVIKPPSIGFGEIALCAADGTSKDFVVDNLLEEIVDYEFNIPNVKAYYKEEPPYPIFLRVEGNAPQMQMHVGDQIYAVESTTEPGLFAVKNFTYFQLEEAFSEAEETSVSPEQIVWLEEIN